MLSCRAVGRCLWASGTFRYGLCGARSNQFVALHLLAAARRRFCESCCGFSMMGPPSLGTEAGPVLLTSVVAQPGRWINQPRGRVQHFSKTPRNVESFRSTSARHGRSAEPWMWPGATPVLLRVCSHQACPRLGWQHSFHLSTRTCHQYTEHRLGSAAAAHPPAIGIDGSDSCTSCLIRLASNQATAQAWHVTPSSCAGWDLDWLRLSNLLCWSKRSNSHRSFMRPAPDVAAFPASTADRAVHLPRPYLAQQSVQPPAALRHAAALNRRNSHRQGSL
jgi:hypothetical protein